MKAMANAARNLLYLKRGLDRFRLQEDLQILKRQRELQDRRHRRYLEEQGLEEHV
jgi:hypothetical protein